MVMDGTEGGGDVESSDKNFKKILTFSCISNSTVYNVGNTFETNKATTINVLLKDTGKG